MRPKHGVPVFHIIDAYDPVLPDGFLVSRRINAAVIPARSHILLAAENTSPHRRVRAVTKPSFDLTAKSRDHWLEPRHGPGTG